MRRRSFVSLTALFCISTSSTAAAYTRARCAPPALNAFFAVQDTTPQDTTPQWTNIVCNCGTHLSGTLEYPNGYYDDTEWDYGWGMWVNQGNNYLVPGVAHYFSGSPDFAGIGHYFGFTDQKQYTTYHSEWDADWEHAYNMYWELSQYCNCVQQQY